MAMGYNFLQDKMFKCPSEYFAPRFDGPPLEQHIGDADVKEIKFGRTNDATLWFFLKRRHKARDQRVLQNLKVFPHGRAADAVFSGDVGKIHYFSITKRRSFQKPGKGRHVASQRFSGNLFFQIISYIRAPQQFRRARYVMPRQAAVIERARQIKPGTLRWYQREQFIAQRPPAQEIAAAA